MRKNIITGIYCIENIVTKKKYIGQSVSIYDRWSKHKSELNHGIHDNDYMQKAWDKYGEDNFIFSVLEICEIQELDEKEKYYIDLFDALNRDCGYNLKTGGQNGGATVSEEIRKKMSEANKNAYVNNPSLINKRKEDALKQWSDPNIKAKIMGENNGMYGKTHSKETRQKLADFRKDKTPVLCAELNKIFDCAYDAAKELNLSSYRILCACRGKYKTSGGYHWQFVKGNNI